jgi:hypothetical protein
MLQNLRTKMGDFINNFAKKYSSLFQEGIQAAWSMMRYIIWFIVTDVMIVWTVISFRNWRVEDIPMGVVTIILAAIGGKVLQKSKEGKEVESTPNVTQ